MDKIKILIVSRSFYPESSPRAFRTTELVKEFATQGHDVTLLTTERDYDYTEFKKKYNVKIDSIGPLKWTKFNTTGFLGEYKRKLGRLFFLFLNFPDIEIMFRLKKVLRNYTGYDLLISVAAPHPVHWGVAATRTSNHRIAKTWVADCGDPYMGATLESMSPPFYFAKLEKGFCRKADFISVPAEGSKNGYYPEFRQKIEVIPQGFNFDEFVISKQYIPHPVPTFAYAGGVAGAGVRYPGKVLDLLLKSNKDFRFHVYSSNASSLLPYAEKAPDKIILHAAVTRDTLLNKLAAMDFLLNLDNGTVNQTPSKLIDYALAGRPVLNILADNPDEVLIEEFLSGNYNRKLAIPPLENYNIKNVARKFLNLIDK